MEGAEHGGSSGYHAGMRRTAVAALAALSLLAMSACSGATRRTSDSSESTGIGLKSYVWSPARDTHISLVPLINGGYAGWCMQIVTRAVRGDITSHSRECVRPTASLAGPILYESCEERGEGPVVYVLTQADVASVAIGRGTPVRTATGSTLPDGLRVAALEAGGHEPRQNFTGCQPVMPLNARGKPIPKSSKSGAPLSVELPHATWAHPDKPLRGVCGLTATKLAPGLGPLEGSVATTVRPILGLLGRAFLSCARTVYFRPPGEYVTAAVLLDAERPGSDPPRLPAMQPLAGHSGLFEAPSSEGEVLARRIPGAWLVAAEQSPGGLVTALELIENLQAEA
jgi:hypothetical protein